MDHMAHGTPKSLEWLQHIWPYVSGFFLTVAMGVRLWWSDKKQTKERIARLETIAENCATKTELNECHAAVLSDLNESLKLIYKKMEHGQELIFRKTDEMQREQRRDAATNSQQHQDMLREMGRRPG